MASDSSVENTLQLQVKGWAAKDSTGVLSPVNFTRRKQGAEEVTIEIKYCGVCHTDLHYAKNDWGITAYPLVPGHEITGVVTAVGSQVNKFAVGDKVAVGCLSGSCRSCDECDQGLENYCSDFEFVYNSVSKDGTVTKGGYSNLLVIHQRYVVKFPEKLPMDAGAPLLCAGITIYSAMKYYGMRGRGKRMGVVGLGGLGHLAVKFGKAMELEVTVISTSPSKAKEAVQGLGAHHFLLSTDPTQMKESCRKLDFILDTVSGDHAMQPLLNLLKVNGKLIMVGAPAKPLSIPSFSLIFERRMVAGSMIGGMPETQEMLEFCAEHGICCEIETIPMDYINTAMDRLSKSDVKYRFVIDIVNAFKESKWATLMTKTL